MISPLLIKSISASLTVAIAGAGGFVIYSKGLFNNSDTFGTKNSTPRVSLQAILIATASSSEGSNVLSNNGYKCQIQNSQPSDAVECSISVLNGGEKAQLYLDEIKNDSSSGNTAIDKTTLNTSTNTFKIKTTDNFIDKWKASTSKNIKIVSKDASPVEIATLNTLFGIKKDSSLVGKTQHFLGKATTFTQVDSGSVNNPITKASNVFKCYIGDSANNSSAKPCEFYEYSNNESNLSDSKSDKDLNYKHDAQTTDTITQYKHYLLKYTGSNESDHVDISSEWTSDKKIILHIQQNSSVSDEVTTGTKQVEFTAHAPVFFTSDTNKKALILKNKPTI